MDKIIFRLEDNGFRLLKISPEGESSTAEITWKILGNSAAEAFNIPKPQYTEDNIIVDIRSTHMHLFNPYKG